MLILISYTTGREFPEESKRIGYYCWDTQVVDALWQTFTASSLTTSSNHTYVMAVATSTAVAPRSITTLYLTWGKALVQGARGRLRASRSAVDEAKVFVALFFNLLMKEGEEVPHSHVSPVFYHHSSFYKSVPPGVQGR